MLGAYKLAKLTSVPSTVVCTIIDLPSSSINTDFTLIGTFLGGLSSHLNNLIG